MAQHVRWSMRRFWSSNVFQRLPFEIGSTSISTSVGFIGDFQIEIGSNLFFEKKNIRNHHWKTSNFRAPKFRQEPS